MNIVQMHRGVKAGLDQINTPRFEDWQIDNAINKASDFITRNKIAGTQENGQRVSFQKIQIIRDELLTIVKEKDTTSGLAVSGNNYITKASFPTDYKYLIALEYQINSVAKDWSVPISYNELPLLKKDPYKRPNQDFPPNFYHVESNNGIELFYDKQTNDSVSFARILYLAEAIKVNLGIKYGPNTTTGSVIAYTECVYNGTTYYPGDTITISSAVLHTSGTVVKNFVNSDLPNSLHTEIVNEASIILNTDIENFDKWKAMREETIIRKQ